jgi:hypothetical protein
MDKVTARKRAAALAIVVLIVLWGAIYVGYFYLSRPLGQELAGWVSLALGLATGGVIFPIQNAYVAWEAKRYCARNGHALEHAVAYDGRPFVHCIRCYAVMVSERAGN